MNRNLLKAYLFSLSLSVGTLGTDNNNPTNGTTQQYWKNNSKKVLQDLGQDETKKTVRIEEVSGMVKLVSYGMNELPAGILKIYRFAEKIRHVQNLLNESRSDDQKKLNLDAEAFKALSSGKNDNSKTKAIVSIIQQYSYNGTNWKNNGVKLLTKKELTERKTKAKNEVNASINAIDGDNSVSGNDQKAKNALDALVAYFENNPAHNVFGKADFSSFSKDSYEGCLNAWLAACTDSQNGQITPKLDAEYYGGQQGGDNNTSIPTEFNDAIIQLIVINANINALTGDNKKNKQKIADKFAYQLYELWKFDGYKELTSNIESELKTGLEEFYSEAERKIRFNNNAKKLIEQYESEWNAKNKAEIIDKLTLLQCLNLLYKHMVRIEYGSPNGQRLPRDYSLDFENGRNLRAQINKLKTKINSFQIPELSKGEWIIQYFPPFLDDIVKSWFEISSDKIRSKRGIENSAAEFQALQDHLEKVIIHNQKVENRLNKHIANNGGKVTDFIVERCHEKYENETPSAYKAQYSLDEDSLAFKYTKIIIWLFIGGFSINYLITVVIDMYYDKYHGNEDEERFDEEDEEDDDDEFDE